MSKTNNSVYNASEYLYNDILASTNIISGEEYQEIILNIAQCASDLVKGTLGPYGATTIIDDGIGGTYPTKDGWNCLSRLRFSDPIYNTAFSIIRQVSFNSVTSVGDGTTTAMVGANAFLKRFNTLKKQLGNFRQVDFLDTLKRIKDEVVDRLKNSPELSRIDPTGDFSEIYKIAYVATNGNEEISAMIQKIYQETLNPHIHVTIGLEGETKFEIQAGYKFECSHMMHHAYVTEEDGSYVEKKESLVAIFPHAINFTDHFDILELLLQVAGSKKKPLFIMAPHIDDMINSNLQNAISTAIRNGGGIPMVSILQIPATMDFHRATIADLALITNGTLIDDAKVRLFHLLRRQEEKRNQINVDTRDADLADLAHISKEIGQIDAMLSTDVTANQLVINCLGRTNRIVIQEKNTGFIQEFESIANMTEYNNMVSVAKTEYEALKKRALKNTQGSLMKDYMDAHLRYVRLLGKTGLISVGGGSDLAKRCDKDAIDDAVLACRSAFEFGYVRGLNLSIMQTIMDVAAKYPDPKESDDYAVTICGLLLATFFDVSMEVLGNKYPSKLPHKVRWTDTLGDNEQMMVNNDIIRLALKNGWGYDLVKDRFEIGEITIINSVNTDIQILSSIVSILSLIMTSTQVVSTTKTFDQKLSERQKVESENARVQRIAKIVANEIAPVLQGVFGTSVEANLDECKCGGNCGCHDEVADVDPVDVNILACPVCNHEYLADTIIANMVETSDGGRQFTCVECGNALTVMDVDHEAEAVEAMEAFSDDLKNLEEQLTTPDEASESYCCTNCGYSFRKYVEMADPETNLLCIKCPKCNAFNEIDLGATYSTETGFVKTTMIPSESESIGDETGGAKSHFVCDNCHIDHIDLVEAEMAKYPESSMLGITCPNCEFHMIYEV